VFERWDGKGYPHGASGEAIPVVARVLHVARDAVVFAAEEPPDEVCARIAARAGGAYDPRLAAAMTPQILAGTGAPPPTATGAAPPAAPTWDSLLAHLAAPRAPLSGDALDAALGAVADFADLKSPSTLGHSHRVAELAEAAAWRLDLGAEVAADVRRAGL